MQHPENILTTCVLPGSKMFCRRHIEKREIGDHTSAQDIAFIRIFKNAVELAIPRSETKSVGTVAPQDPIQPLPMMRRRARKKKIEVAAPIIRFHSMSLPYPSLHLSPDTLPVPIRIATRRTYIPRLRVMRREGMHTSECDGGPFQSARHERGKQEAGFLTGSILADRVGFVLV